MGRKKPEVTQWRGAPQMDTGAPVPAIALHEGSLLVAYLVAHPSSASSDEFAVVRFHGVCQHTFGYPNEDALPTHPIFGAGLAFYAFNEIHNSPYLDELGARNGRIFPGTEQHYASFRHWLVAFHDETLEVVGRSVEFIGTIEAPSAAAALAPHAA
jgi:hypothetical protein